MSKKISQFDTITARNNDDWLLIEEATTGVYKKIKVADFLSGLGNIGEPPPTTSSYDTNAQAVITAIQNTGLTLSTAQKDACNARIVAMKNSQVWEKRITYYGFLGGTAAAHSINWKSPGTYNLVWNGSVNHSGNGVQGDGSTGYADTLFNPQVAGLGANFHFHFYNRTDNPAAIADAGIRDTRVSDQQLTTHLKWTDSQIYFDAPLTRRISTSAGSILGTIIESITATNAFISIKGVTKISVDVPNANLNAFNLNIHFLRRNANDNNLNYSNRQYSAFGFGYELTQAQASSEHESEQTYQSALGRSI